MKVLRGLSNDYLLLALFTIPAVLPLLLNPGLPNTADGVLHLYRTVELDRAWRDGVFYPRIAPDFAYGYGYPIFNYYAPLFYWLTQIFHTVGLSFELALKSALVLIFYLYPLGMYLFARTLMARGAALVAAMAYLYVPYRFYEAFIQGDYPQFLALAMVPFCLWAVTPTPTPPPYLRGGGSHFFTFILAYAALVLSHNITALITTPLIGASMLFVLFQHATVRSLPVGRNTQHATRFILRLRSGQAFHVLRFASYALSVVSAIILAVGLTAFFWLPALGEQKYVRIERLTHGFFDFRHYFLTLGELLSPNIPPDLAGVNPYIPFNLGPVILLLAVIGLVASAVAYIRRVSLLYCPSDYLFFAVAALVLTLMTLPISAPLWEHVPLLALTEFPWRFVGVAAIPLAVLVGFAIQVTGDAWRVTACGPCGASSSSPVTRHPSLVNAIAIPLIVLDSFVYLFPRTPFLEYGNPSLRDIARFEVETQALGTTSAGEYLPLWTQRRMYDSPLLDALRAGRVPDHLDRKAVPSGTMVQAIKQTVAQETHRITSSAPFLLHVQRIYFPGWSATIDGQPTPFDLAAPYGTMRLAVPAGEHLVEFKFGETLLRQVADGISLLALVMIVIWLSVRACRRQLSVDEPTRTQPSPLVTCEAPHPSPVTCEARHSPLIVSLALIAFYFIAPRLGYVRFSPLPQVIGMQYARVENLGDEMRLLGYDLSAPKVTAGDALALTLYWQPLRVSPNDYAVFVHLDNPLTLETVAETSRAHPGNISTVDLPLSLYVRDSHVLTTTTALEAGLYLLRVGLVDTRANTALQVRQPDGSRRGAVTLQTIRVRRASPVDLSGAARTQIHFDSIELIGYALDPQNQLTLTWRPLQTPNRDATVFVHLLDASNQPIATFDGPPAGGLLPISAWEKDEIVVDRRLVTPKSPGNFRIAIGLYDPQSLQRYRAETADGQRLPNDQFILDRGVEVRP